MKLRMKAFPVQISPADVEAFELRRGFQLPYAYRLFLMESNGGYVDGDFVFVVSREEGESILQKFYHLNDKTRSTSTLDYMIDLYNKRIPRELIPIACDIGGGKICLGVSGGILDSVYFWDPEMDYEDAADGSFANIHRISKSFTGFLDSLTISGAT